MHRPDEWMTRVWEFGPLAQGQEPGPVGDTGAIPSKRRPLARSGRAGWGPCGSCSVHCAVHVKVLCLLHRDRAALQR